MNYQIACFKRNVEYILTIPLVWLGKYLSAKLPISSKHRYFAIIRSADVGGSNKVTFDILDLLPNDQVVVIATKKAYNNGMFNRIQSKQYTFIDLSKFIDNKWLYFLNIFYRGVLAGKINKLKEAYILGGECIYFFKIIPYLNSHIKTIELSHLNTWMDYTQSFWKFIDFKINSTEFLSDIYRKQISKNGIPNEYIKKIRTIESWVEIPNFPIIHQTNKVNILFVGRGAQQKRVHLLVSILNELLDKDYPFYFTFIGDVEKYICGENKYYKVISNISDPKLLDQEYNKADILILTSSNEGLPIVVMEMMARGKVVISTAVGAIPYYITNNANGILINDTNETEIVNNATKQIIYLTEHPEVRFLLGKNAYEYSKANFGYEQFRNNFEEILNFSE